MCGENMAGNVNDYKYTYISGNLQKDIAYFKELFKKDVILREINRSNDNASRKLFQAFIHSNHYILVIKSDI